MKYQYELTMKWMNRDENNNVIDDETINIDNDHIKQITVINDYENTNMPIMYASLMIDKNYIDKIIKNVKTAIIYLEINSMVIDEKDNTNISAKHITPYSGILTYFINQDINYNKDIEYKGDTSDSSKELLKTFTIGMMYEKCIEMNKNTTNITFIDTTPINEIAYFLKEYPLLIEPFDYNTKYSQLIVPPMDSLSKTIDFLNNVKVFYSTTYRFYIEPECIYLMSTSGKGVPKIGDEFDTCFFNVIPIDKSTSIKDGSNEDADNMCYQVDVHVKDTFFKIDTDTSKVYNSLISIIDPSIQSTSRNTGKGIAGLINKVNDIKDKINKTINDSRSLISDIPRTLSSESFLMSASADAIGYVIDRHGIPSTNNAFVDTIVKNEVAYQLREKGYTVYECGSMEAPLVIDNAIAEIENMKKLYIVKTTGGEKHDTKTKRKLVVDKLCDDQIKLLKYYKLKILSCKDSTKEINNNINDLKNNAIGCLMEMSSSESCFGGVEAENVCDNKESLKNKYNNCKKCAKGVQSSVNNLRENVNKINDLKVKLDQTKRVLSMFRNVYDLYMRATEENKPTVNPFDALISSLTSSAACVNKNSNTIKEGLVKAEASTSATLKMHKSMSNTMQTAISITNRYDNIVRSGLEIVNSIKGLKNSIREVRKLLTEQYKSMKKIGEAALSKFKQLNFSAGSLNELKTNINLIKDIENIGVLGVKQFEIAFNLNGTNDKGSLTGVKIIRIPNDNANMARNIKSDQENHSKMITMTKTDVDTSVFTPNKRYVINNYDGHSELNGSFILNKKIDYFLPSGDKFTISTVFDLMKVASENLNESSADKVSSVLSLLNNICGGNSKASNLINKGIEIAEGYKKAKNAYDEYKSAKKKYKKAVNKASKPNK